MVRGPKKVSHRPKPLDLEDPRGDVLADVLGASLVRHAIYRRIEARAPWGIRLVPSGRAVFYLVARGTARLEVDGEPPLTLSAGEAAFVPRGAPLTLRDSPSSDPVPVCDGRHAADGGARRIGGTGARTSFLTGFFELGARPPALLAGLPRVVALSPTDGRSGPWVAATIRLLLAESAEPGPASALVLQRLADVLFVQALRSLAAHPCSGVGLAALADPAIHQALGLMHARVAEPWTVARLASGVGLSRSAFAARFTDLVGEPPLHYLARWRVMRAAELLRDTDDGVVEIAARVGYQSVPSFSKAFLRWQGERPGAFRRTQGASRRAPAGAQTRGGST